MNFMVSSREEIPFGVSGAMVRDLPKLSQRKRKEATKGDRYQMRLKA
jgi:hypothetical protein